MKLLYVFGFRVLGQLALLSVLTMSPALAHDPVFGLGPHVLFKGGVEVAPQIHTEKEEDDRGTELGVELTYGITGDWAAGIELPYIDNSGISDNGGPGDIRLFTKYRFWRRDSTGLQESAAILAKVKFDTSAGGFPPLGSGSTDGLLGLAYGYESRKWYRWASVRYRVNGKSSQGFRRGNKLLFDLVGGIRLKPTAYDEPDTVWLVELNGEYTDRSVLGGANLASSGGTEWFVSPGIFWTLRNFAIKVGVQIPVASDLNSDQPETDYRARLVLEWHL
jgi:hypothetical protein